MPTYDYKCTECNYTFEEFQKITDDPLEKCPKCGGKVKRLIGTGMAPIFKGSGFYQTDYKNSHVNGSSEKKQKKEQPKPDSPNDTSKKAV